MALDPLDWFPKQFSPGDMDGTGGDRLLGRSQLSPLEILIRETAQNSWDARNPGSSPAFGVNLRRTTPRLRSDLVSLLRNGRNEELQSRELDQSFRVLEIFDRGTRGLDGPIDLTPARPGEASNYQDLILKVGVATHDGAGGGTYGFGKTAAFAYSRIGTVVYWTRCRTVLGTLEHRFIVSAIRSSYTVGNTQFTGRHWWGVVDGGTVLPVRGDRAEQLGAQLFERGFDEGETGTSVLILDPVHLVDPHGDEDEPPRDEQKQMRLFADEARSAIRMHLWPKLVTASEAQQSPMRISLRAGGEEIPLDDDPAGVIALWRSGLNAVRAAELGQVPSERPPTGARVGVFEVVRYKKVLGRLALVRYAVDVVEKPESDDLDPRAENARLDRICLMRNQAELVVCTVPWFDRTPEDGTDWLAVYKPAAEFDKDYAASEPPAHDDWVSSGAEDEVAKIVRHTRTRVTRILREQLFPEPSISSAEGTGADIDTGDLARRLSSLLPAAAPDIAPAGGSRTRSGARRAQAPKAEIVASPPYLVGTDAEGAQHQRIGFRLIGPIAQSLVALTVSQIGDQGVREAVPPHMLSIRWSGEAKPVGHDRAWIPSDVDCWVEFFGPPRRALRIELKPMEA